jgi:hypothetical protein
LNKQKLYFGENFRSKSNFYSIFGHEQTHVKFNHTEKLQHIEEGICRCVEEDIGKIFSERYNDPEFLHSTYKAIINDIWRLYDYSLKRSGRRSSHEMEYNKIAYKNKKRPDGGPFIENHALGTSTLKLLQSRYGHDVYKELFRIGLGFVVAGFPVFDSIAAIAVALLMLFISYKLGKKSIGVLMDQSPEEGIIKGMEKILESTRGVEKFHKLKARQAGNKIHVDVHIHVRPNMSVYEGHRLAHEVKRKLMDKFPSIKDVIVHVEPAEKKAGARS